MLTAVIPYADYHAGMVENAIASVQAQTVPTRWVLAHDAQHKGAGWARNQGLAQVSTPFVTFLDADDTLEPTFAAETLAAYREGVYVYTDWRQDGHGVEAPNCAWVKGRWHVVTTLLAAEDVRRVGGFDETLKGAEDTEFYYKLTRSGVCGVRLAKPLFHYGKGGQRGQTFVTGNDYWPTMQLIQTRYKEYPMSCCGEDEAMEIPPTGETFEGAVLAMALWQGNRTERGRATGRPYPRLSYPRTTWVDPRDIEAAPNLWRAVNANGQSPIPQARPVVQINRPNGVQQVGNRLFANVTPAPELQRVEKAPVSPDFQGVINKARRALG